MLFIPQKYKFLLSFKTKKAETNVFVPKKVKKSSEYFSVSFKIEVSTANKSQVLDIEGKISVRDTDMGIIQNSLLLFINYYFQMKKKRLEQLRPILFNEQVL